MKHRPKHRVRPQKRTTADKTREAFYTLTLDWIHLRSVLPTPARADRLRRSNTREYGHPAEWASDKAAQIAAILTEWHDLMAEHRNETAPPGGCEQTRVTAAWRYLEPRFDQLCELVDREAFQEITDLHRGIQATLGVSNPPHNLPIPCPNNECGLLTLQRIVGVGRDFISCGHCGYTISETYYPFLVRMALDTLIDAA